MKQNNSIKIKGPGKYWVFSGFNLYYSEYLGVIYAPNIKNALYKAAKQCRDKNLSERNIEYIVGDHIKKGWSRYSTWDKNYGTSYYNIFYRKSPSFIWINFVKFIYNYKLNLKIGAWVIKKSNSDLRWELTKLKINIHNFLVDIFGIN
jgi:hypothetical protein